MAVNEAIELQSRTETAKPLEPPCDSTTHENETAPRIANWQTEPEKLPVLTGRLPYIVTDIGLLILCLSFLALSAAASISNGKALDKSGKLLIRVAGYVSISTTWSSKYTC